MPVHRILLRGYGEARVAQAEEMQKRSDISKNGIKGAVADMSAVFSAACTYPRQ